MRILIAGGAGFIGYHLTRRLLREDQDVVVVDNFSSGTAENVMALREEFPRARYAVHVADVRSLRWIDIDFDAVLHLASVASPVDYLRWPIETLEAGSLGTFNLLGIARSAGARFLLASTSEVYGDPEVHPQPESYWGHVNPVGPRSVYDEAKRFAEAYVSAHARTHDLPVRIARIFNTYGPRMRAGDGRVLSTFLRQALRGEPLTVQGDGQQTRSFCYVEDLVDGLLGLLMSGVEGPVNLGNPEEMTVLEAARAVLAVTRSASPIVHVPALVDDPRRRRPDITRARSELGWEPRIPFREGLARMADAMREELCEQAQPGPPASRLDGRPPANRSPRRGASAPASGTPLRQTGST